MSLLILLCIAFALSLKLCWLNPARQAWLSRYLPDRDHC